MTQALYRRWRPRTFEEVVGQDHVVRTLRNALNSGRIHHAYLFAGPRGTGKTTTARLLAKAVNCLAPDPTQRPCNECAICRAVNEGRLMDLIEIDAASNTGVDDVRELRERVGFRPNEARYKVYVIDEVHMLSNAAFNALLKTLEEPPPHAIFVLATTEPHRIPATIHSRCQRFDFRRIPAETIVERLEHIAQGEGIVADREALTLIARQATGSMRDAESLLDQLAAYTDEGITVEVVRAALGTGAEEAVMGLVDALATGDTAQGLALINRVVDQGTDPRQFARQLVEHLRGLLLTRLGSDETPLHVPDGLREAFRAQAARFSARQLARAVRLFNKAAAEARAAWQPQLPLELAFVEAVLPLEEAAPVGGAPSTPAFRARRTTPSTSPRPRSASPPSAAPTAALEEPQAVIAPSPAPAPPPSPAEGMPTLQEFEARWPDLLHAIRAHNHSLEALLRSGRPLSVEGETLVIGFRYPFHRGKVAEEDNRRAVEDALGELFGRSVRVRCELAPDEQKGKPANPPRPAPPPPRPQTGDTPRETPAQKDELVEAAVKKLGARVSSRPFQAR